MFSGSLMARLRVGISRTSYAALFSVPVFGENPGPLSETSMNTLESRSKVKPEH
jgi:hypothetical protein